MVRRCWQAWQEGVQRARQRELLVTAAQQHHRRALQARCLWAWACVADGAMRQKMHLQGVEQHRKAVQVRRCANGGGPGGGG